jgi:class 3 adenylate cyclase
MNRAASGHGSASTEFSIARTFAFLHLDDFSAYGEANGMLASVRALGLLRTVLRESAAAHGVRVARWLRDGAMLSGIVSQDVVACSMVVRQRVAERGGLSVRGGLARGEVIMFEGDDYVGPPVDIAARLAELADRHQLLASVDVGALAAVDVEVTPLAPAEMLGSSIPIAICQLVATPGGHRSPHHRPSPRDDERDGVGAPWLRACPVD